MSTTLELVRLHHDTGNLGDLLAPALRAHASNIAIIDISNGDERIFTYDALETEIRRAVGAAIELGLRRGDRAAIALPNSAAFLIALFALMRIGVVPVLLNPKLATNALRFILRDSNSRAVFADLGETPVFAELAAECNIPYRLGHRAVSGPWLDWSALCAAAKPNTHVEPMQFDEQAFQPYTAGSTGMPKGIVMTHGGMLWGIEHGHAHWPVTPDTRAIVAAPLFHKNAMRGTVKRMLRGGASFVIQARFNAREYLETLDRYRVTSCAGVPTMFAEMLRHVDILIGGNFQALRSVSMGSSIVPPELLARIAAAFPNAKTAESYGLTEGGGPFGPPTDGRAVPRGSVGMAAPECEVRLVDEHGDDAQQGELWIRSPYVMKEYANNPLLTQERLRDGWLRTGDVLRVDAAGFYYFVGRTDDMFVCGGENVYPKDVEQLILGHPSVSDVIVAPLAHETKGYAPAALVLARSGHPLTAVQLQDYCAAHGPAFMIPRAVLFTEEIPITSAGKPDRKAVAAQLQAAFGTLSSRVRSSRP